MPHPAMTISAEALGALMPLHMTISATGHITGCGPTLAKLFPAAALLDQRFFDQFEVRRPSGITSITRLHQRLGARLYLHHRASPQSPAFRSIGIPLADGNGILLNLSFGIGILDAVRLHALTDADFAATDMAIELLYLFEAKTAVMQELRALNLRLYGAKTEAEELALTDTLTGLRNRRALDLALNRAIATGKPFGLMHLDLDFFKAVNDTLGHAAGDFVLRAVADVLTNETRMGDTVARVGGDEFVIILPGMTDPTRMAQIARRIIAKISEPIDFEGKECRVSASVGMVASPVYAGLDADQMLSDADDALYASKRAGRAQAQMHGPQQP